MSAVPQFAPASADMIDLQSGDRMTRREFHRIYQQMPKDFKAELIGGIVYVASPLRQPHAVSHPALSAVLFAYSGATPGVEVGDNATVLLADDAEPQPDLYLRILPAYGGQSIDTVDQYIEGAPELVAEIAHSSRAIDLHDKRDDYRRYGVLEYLVLSVTDQKLHWFDLRNNQELHIDPDGILRSRYFPGLWVNRDALLTRDASSLMSTLGAGLARPGHAQFVQKLAGQNSSRG